jgi:hypothetical protein
MTRKGLLTHELRNNGMVTDDEFKTEEGRIAMAEAAGRRVAKFELKEGHNTPRSWEKDGDPYAGAYSHLAAAGFTRIGTRMYVLTFIRAYKSEFPDTGENEQ